MDAALGYTRNAGNIPKLLEDTDKQLAAFTIVSLDAASSKEALEEKGMQKFFGNKKNLFTVTGTSG